MMPNSQHPPFALHKSVGAATVTALVLLYVLLFDLHWDNKKTSCVNNVHSPVATATCRALSAAMLQRLRLKEQVSGFHSAC